MATVALPLMAKAVDCIAQHGNTLLALSMTIFAFYIIATIVNAATHHTCFLAPQKTTPTTWFPRNDSLAEKQTGEPS
jgi:hypothetical protein